MEALEALLLEVAQETLAPVRRVEIEPGVGSDGEEILWIEVILEGGQRDPGRLIAFKLAARDLLEDAGEMRFPVFRFIDAEERRKSAVA